MKTISEKDQFPGFEQPVSDLAKFIRAGNLFTLMLKNGKIVHFTTKDSDCFMQWLLENSIVNIKESNF